VYIATLYGGSITFATPMLWALAFMAEFLIGGVTGIYLGASGADVYFHDTYFVIAHFHYTFFPIAIIAVMSVRPAVANLPLLACPCGASTGGRRSPARRSTGIRT